MHDTVPRQTGWVIPLLAILGLQSVASFLNQMLPVLSPVIGAAQGWPPTAVGYFAAVSMFGSIVYLLFGVPVMHATGPIRVVQFGLIGSIAAVALLFVPAIGAALLASLLIGIAYGTIMPAGSQILQQHAPARHRSLVFSIKQAGVPLGAALSGSLLPLAVVFGGWTMALLVVGAVVVATVLIVEPARRQIDGPVVSTGWLGLLRPIRLRAVTEPFKSLTERPGLVRLAIVGACLAAQQGSWNAFLVTFLVHETGISLTAAGALFSVMQISAIGGRLLLGVVSDRLGSAIRIIQLSAVVSTLVSVALVFLAPTASSWVLGILLIFAGILITGWNGIHLAELAQRAPVGRVAEVSSGGMVLVSVGLMGGPFATATLLALTGRFDIALLSVAALPALSSLLLMRRGLANP